MDQTFVLLWQDCLATFRLHQDHLEAARCFWLSISESGLTLRCSSYSVLVLSPTESLIGEQNDSNNIQLSPRLTPSSCQNPHHRHRAIWCPFCPWFSCLPCPVLLTFQLNLQQLQVGYQWVSVSLKSNHSSKKILELLSEHITLTAGHSFHSECFWCCQSFGEANSNKRIETVCMHVCIYLNTHTLADVQPVPVSHAFWDMVYCLRGECHTFRYSENVTGWITCRFPIILSHMVL